MKHFLIIALMSLGLSQSFSQGKKNQPAPELALPAPDHSTVRLADLKGKVVLVDFWASWCPPCRENNPHLARLYKKYHDKGLEILSVSLDSNESSWKEAIRQDHATWLQVNDNRGWNAPSIVSFDVGAIPTMYLLDKNGIIREINLEGWKLEDQIRYLLKKG